MPSRPSVCFWVTELFWLLSSALLILLPYCFLFLPTWRRLYLCLLFFLYSFLWRPPSLLFTPLSPQSQNTHHQHEDLSPSIINDKCQSNPWGQGPCLPFPSPCCWKERINYHLNTRISKIHLPLLTSVPESRPLFASKTTSFAFLLPPPIPWG